MKDSITCIQAVDYISKKEEGKLSAWQRVKLWRHLAGCSLCQRFSVQNKLITKLLSGHDAAKDHLLTDDEKNRMAEQILTNKNDQSING